MRKLVCCTGEKKKRGNQSRKRVAGYGERINKLTTSQWTRLTPRKGTTEGHISMQHLTNFLVAHTESRRARLHQLHTTQATKGEEVPRIVCGHRNSGPSKPRENLSLPPSKDLKTQPETQTILGKNWEIHSTCGRNETVFLLVCSTLPQDRYRRLGCGRRKPSSARFG